MSGGREVQTFALIPNRQIRFPQAGLYLVSYSVQEVCPKLLGRNRGVSYSPGTTHEDAESADTLDPTSFLCVSLPYLPLPSHFVRLLSSIISGVWLTY